MKRALPLVLTLAATLVQGGTAFGQSSCSLPQTFNDPHPVIHDDESLLWVRPLQVDADGAPNAYHRDDPFGGKGLAIEYLGNGMTISRNDEPLPFLTDDDKPDPKWLEAYKKLVRNRWEAPPGYAVDIYGFARGESGKVCVTNSGRLISSTSLTLNSKLPACNPKRYMDALKFPGIVVPSRGDNETTDDEGDYQVATPFADRGVHRGDLAVVYNPETNRWKGALLYDTGPRHLLGEGSIRLVMNLRGMDKVPTSAVETNSLGIAKTTTVLFPKSAALLGPKSTWTPEKIERVAAEQFIKWGGGSIEGALQRLQACTEAYAQAQQPQ
jgi:hypothetical protein